MKQSTEERARSRTSTPHRKDRPMRKLGKHLKVGDTIEVWWRPGRDTILAVDAYDGPLAYVWEAQGGARLAAFAINRSGMTIEPGERFIVVASTAKRR